MALVKLTLVDVPEKVVDEIKEKSTSLVDRWYNRQLGTPPNKKEIETLKEEFKKANKVAISDRLIIKI